MRSSISTALALSALMLVGDALAGPHQKHQEFHNRKRDEVIVEDVITTVYTTEYITVIWPSTNALAPPVIDAAKPAAPLDNPSSSSSSSTSTSTSSSSQPAIPSPALNVDVKVPAAAAAPIIVSTPPASSSSQAPASASPTGLELGLAYNSMADADEFLQRAPFKWAYNWANDPNGEVPDGVEYCYMLWGPAPEFSDDWASIATAAIANGSKHILSFNEVDEVTQVNLNVSQAVEAYMEFIQPLAVHSGVQLGAPSVTNGPAAQGMGLGYLKSFLPACQSKGCKIDFLNLHYYAAASGIDDFKSYIQGACSEFGKPIWITEAGVTGSDQEISDWIQEAVEFLKSSCVERIAYFMVADDYMLTNGAVNAVGDAWIAASS